LDIVLISHLFVLFLFSGQLIDLSLNVGVFLLELLMLLDLGNLVLEFLIFSLELVICVVKILSTFFDDFCLNLVSNEIK
jgi:hypothetical protein